MNNIKLCIVVPIYNHGKQLYKTIANIAKFELPIIMVDDGSNQETKDAIVTVTSDFEALVTLHSLEQNMGKGVAVTTGAAIAKDIGYTHIFQIDADGQHDSDDVPKFIEMMHKNPTALISGMPEYDESIPKSRLHGRKITNFWVAIETWTMSITEAMCGFRIYPLDAYTELSDRKSFSPKMDFDIDVIVRSYWYGVPIKFITTKVIYPKDGYSNFRMLKDNIRISWTHTKLCFGMIIRSPILLWKKLK